MSTVEEISSMPGFAELSDAAKTIVLKSASDYSSVTESSSEPWWRRPGYQFIIPESIRSGIGEAVRGAIESPITQGAMSMIGESPVGTVMKAADILINKPIDYLVSSPLGSAAGKVARSVAPYTLPRLLGLEQGTPEGDVAFSQGIESDVRGISNMVAPFALQPGISGIASKMRGVGAAKTGTPMLSKSLTATTSADDIAMANAESQYLYQKTLAERQKTLEGVKERIVQANIAEKNTRIKTVEALESRLQEAKKTEQLTREAGFEDLSAAIEGRKGGLPKARNLIGNISAESLSPTEAGIVIQGPRFEKGVNETGLYWQRMRLAREPFKQEYPAILQKAQAVTIMPVNTIGTYDAILREAGIAGEAFPTAGERAAGSLKVAVQKPLPKITPVGTQARQRLLANPDMLDQEEQGAKIAALINSQVTQPAAGSGRSAHMAVAQYQQLLQGVVDKPEVGLNDLIVARQRLRGAGRSVRDEVVKHQLGDLEIALTADIVKASPEISMAQDILDARYLKEIVPYYVKGAVPRTIVEGKPPGAILQSIVGSPASHDADALVSFKEMINDSATFKKVITRPWIEDQLKKSTSSTTGQWNIDDFLKKLGTLSPEKKAAIFGDSSALIDTFIESVQRINRTKPAITGQLETLSKIPGPEVTSLEKRIETVMGAPRTPWSRISSAIEKSEKESRPGRSELVIPETQPTLRQEYTQRVERGLKYAGSGIGVWHLLSGAATFNAPKAVTGLGILITIPMLSKLMSSEAGLRVLNAGVTAAKTAKNIAFFTAKVNGLINPLRSIDISFEDKIESLADKMTTPRERTG